MKVSDYLWEYIDSMKPGISPEQAQGEMMVKLKNSGDKIESNTTGNEMVEREALSIYGRNQDALLASYNAGDKDAFDAVVIAQLTAGDEYDAANAENSGDEE